MEDLKIRRATANDHERVISINKEVYNGYDYIPFNYHEMLKAPRNFPYVAEDNGRPIAFTIFTVLNEGKLCLAGAARTSKEAQGKGCISRTSKFARNELKKLYPNLNREVKLVVWSDYHEKAGKQHSESLKLFWHFLQYKTTKEDILKSNFMKGERKTVELDTESTIKVLKSLKNQKLFETLPLLAYHWWTPIFVEDNIQLQEYATKNKVFASVVTPNETSEVAEDNMKENIGDYGEVSALSSSMPAMTYNGYISSIFFHSVPSSYDLFFDHVRSHFMHLASVVKDNEPASVNLHFPLDIDVKMVEDLLRADFGDPKREVSKHYKVALFEEEF